MAILCTGRTDNRSESKNKKEHFTVGPSVSVTH